MNPTLKHPLRILAAAALASILASASASAFHVEMEPLFQANQHAVGIQPMAVDLENNGPDAKGVLRISTGAFSMEYPVELPRGSKKRLITYPVTDFGTIIASLDTDQGREIKSFATTNLSTENTPSVLLISDEPGGLAFLRNAGPVPTPTTAGNPNTARPIEDNYCSPADAPPRSVGYSTIRAVVLGTGAERISDATVEALKTWTLAGGTLVFVGGASAPSVSDPRWQSVLPATKFVPKTVQTSDTLAGLGQETTTEPFTLLEPQDLQGASARADGSTIITAESGFGMGRVIYMAFNPLEAPLSHWAGRSRAIQNILGSSLLQSPQAALAQYSREPLQFQAAASIAFPVPGPAGAPDAATLVPGMPSVANEDPFDTKLPPTGQVFGVLAGYFIAVVPLNFLILRKFKRGELAWFTAPILSLAFASVLFKSAGNLYGQKMSTASQGIMLVRDGLPEALFVGTTKVFIPKGGNYDLHMTGIDSIGALEDNPYDYSYRTTNNSLDLNPVDNGEITVPSMHASNLAFREITYRQHVSIGSQYSLSMHRSGAFAVCELKNRGSSDLANATVFVGKRSQAVGTIKAGETKTVKLDLTAPFSEQSGGSPLQSALGYYGGAAVAATLSNFRPGPQIGDEVATRSHVTLLVFSKDALGGIR